MYDITTGTGDFIANGVISHNCFARPTHDYLGLGIGADFDRKIVVKINAVEKLRAELADPKWTGEGVAMGTNTDPYQRCEGKYKLTRGVVEALTEHGNPFSILTKSALVLRDLDLIERASGQSDVTVNFSIGTLDERVWRLTEPGTPHPRRRVEAMRTLAARGIRTGALIAPILPGLSDRRGQLREVVEAVPLNGRADPRHHPIAPAPGYREHFLGWLAEHDPALHQRYLAAYQGRSYLDPSYGRWLTTTVRDLQPRPATRATGATGATDARATGARAKSATAIDGGDQAPGGCQNGGHGQGRLEHQRRRDRGRDHPARPRSERSTSRRRPRGRPREPLDPAARGWPTFAAYVISFFVIGVIWVNHHALFLLIDHVDRLMLFYNLLLLLWVSTIRSPPRPSRNTSRTERPATPASRYCSTASRTRAWRSPSSSSFGTCSPAIGEAGSVAGRAAPRTLALQLRLGGVSGDHGDRTVLDHHDVRALPRDDRYYIVDRTNILPSEQSADAAEAAQDATSSE